MYLFETIFDSAYLVLVVALGIFMLFSAGGIRDYSLFGAMAVVLGCGDAFHLVPRIISMWSAGGFEAHTAALGIGQLVTSITMTVFYIMLYFVWRQRYHIEGKTELTAVMLVLAAVRIALCLMPWNRWTSADAPLSWGIYRNLPFLCMGIITVVLFYREASRSGDKTFRCMWLAIALSFLFYIPVVLFAGVFPPVGALMLPKTVAYVWIVCMGVSDMRKKTKTADAAK